MSEEIDESGDESSQSCTSYSSESSHEFVVDDNYMVLAHADAFDEMSDIVDSVASNNPSTEGPHSKPHLRSTASQRMLPPLAVISEEEESDPCEAYLRAKMTSLWTRIQEIAQKDDLSATPFTEQDTELLRAYQKKNDSLVLLRRQGSNACFTI